MGALFAPIISVASKVIDRVLPDKAANDAAKAQLAQMVASGEINQTMEETKGAAQIITAEAQSQSWLPRNVRPLLLLIWGIAITLDALGVRDLLMTKLLPGYAPHPLDPWVYKLTAIGYTGYVGFRSWEKVKDADN